MLESFIEKKFVQEVQKIGGEAYKLVSPSVSGLPDRLVLLPRGVCAFVELKAPGKKMRPLQEKRAKRLKELGFPVFCIDKVEQIEICIKILSKLFA